MIDGIIRWSLHNRLFVILGAAELIGWGIYQASEMPVDVFPDLTAPTVTVIAEAHGVAPEEVERLVTFPVESALNGATGVRRVRSATSVGVSIVWVEFEWGTDIYRARQVVGEKLQLVQPSLPPAIDPPVLAPISSIMGEVLFVGIASRSNDDADLATVSPRRLRTIADWDVRRRLRLRGDTAVSTLDIVFGASKEIRGSIVFATLIIVLVFLHLFFLHGVEGRLLQPLGVAYVVSLAASLVVALTITPVLCSVLLPTSRAVKRAAEPPLIRWLRAAYEPLLRLVLPAWPALVGLSLVGVILAEVTATGPGRAFLPAFDEGALTMGVVQPLIRLHEGWG